MVISKEAEIFITTDAAKQFQSHTAYVANYIGSLLQKAYLAWTKTLKQLPELLLGMPACELSCVTYRTLDDIQADNLKFLINLLIDEKTKSIRFQLQLIAEGFHESANAQIIDQDSALIVSWWRSYGMQICEHLDFDTLVQHLDLNQQSSVLLSSTTIQKWRAVDINTMVERFAKGKPPRFASCHPLAFEQ